MAKRKEPANVTNKVAVDEKKVAEATEVTEPTAGATEETQQEEVTGATEPTADSAEETQQEEVTGETTGDEAGEQTEEETEAEQEQLEVGAAEAEVTKTTEPTKVTGQTDPFLNSYYKRRIF